MKQVQRRHIGFQHGRYDVIERSFNLRWVEFRSAA